MVIIVMLYEVKISHTRIKQFPDLFSSRSSRPECNASTISYLLFCCYFSRKEREGEETDREREREREEEENNVGNVIKSPQRNGEKTRYVCACACVSTCVCVWVCVCVSTCVCALCMSTCVWVRMCVHCACVCVSTCVWCGVSEWVRVSVKQGNGKRVYEHRHTVRTRVECTRGCMWNLNHPDQTSVSVTSDGCTRVEAMSPKSSTPKTNYDRPPRTTSINSWRAT